MTTETCEYCGDAHDFKCPLIEAIEYYPGPDRQVRRVKFFRPKPIKYMEKGLVRLVGPAVTYPLAKPGDTEKAGLDRPFKGSIEPAAKLAVAGAHRPANE